jgi:hypothetical protein
MSDLVITDAAGAPGGLGLIGGDRGRRMRHRRRQESEFTPDGREGRGARLVTAPTLLASLVLLAAFAVADAAAAYAVDFSIDPVVVTQVGPGAYTFFEGGFSGGASITGAFAGVDVNGDGQLTYLDNPRIPYYPLELTSFNVSFSGNTLAPAFSFGFSQLDNFNYQGGPFLGSSGAIVDGLEEGVEAGSTNLFYDAGPGPGGICDGSGPCGGVLAVPEPATWTMMLIGTLGVGARLRANGRRGRRLSSI